MQGPTIIRDPLLHVNDFDAAADEPQAVQVLDAHNPPHWQMIPGIEREFTTEWQMDSPEEETHAGVG